MNYCKISVCSFNINGTKDKVPSLEEKLSRLDVLFLQEHLLPACSVNFLRRNRDHIVFSTNARRTRGRPSGGLACYIRRTPADSSPMCYHSSEHFLAVRLGDTVLINAYLPHDKKSVQSFSSFAKSCDKLQGLISGIESLGYS
jgi:exonuclease III